MANWNEPTLIGTLAAGYAEVEDFDQAIHWLEKAMQDSEYMEDFGDMAGQRMERYRQKTLSRDLAGAQVGAAYAGIESASPSS